MGGAQPFPLRYERPWRTLLSVLGCGPARSGVRVDDTGVDLRLGWAFRATVARTDVASARPWAGRRPVSRGAHGWRRRWLVNASGDGLVELVLSRPARGRVLFVPIRPRTIVVGVEQPDALVAAVG